MNSEKQLKLWVKGKSTHNDKRNECCPDFSCCRPELLAPEHERKTFLKSFQKGDDKTMTGMLIEFLGRAFSSSKIYIAGYRENRRRISES
ncbi:MAG: hypothetical protein KAR42_16855 [candidate division Zixibacteria bacterium]|nr:hypothetical protein [candidate division Zixibacteria bacterium]